MINWPVRREKPDSDWIKYTSDDDLDLLMVLYDAPVTPETERLARDIKARTLRRMRQRPAPPAEVQPDSMDLETWLHFRWTRADAKAGQTLRAVAKALGILLPMRRTVPPPVPEPAMRRTSPVPAASAELSPSMPRRRNYQHRAAEGVVRRVDESPEPAADEYMLEHRYDDESAWTPCTSLFDALHPENRAWS